MKKAFTLVEIIIVVVILGVVAALAIPRMTGTTEQAVLSEAVNALELLHAAQKRYEMVHPGQYASCNALDVDIVLKNFERPVCIELDVGCGGLCPPGEVTVITGDIKIDRKGGASYTITKSIDGAFSCTGACAGLKLP